MDRPIYTNDHPVSNTSIREKPTSSHFIQSTTMKHTLSKHTLFEYLAGRATPLEKQQTDAWLKDESNTEQFYQWLFEWERQSPQYQTNIDQGYTRLTDKIEEQGITSETASESPVETQRIFRRDWLLAASVVFIFCIAGWLLRKPILYKNYKTDYGQTSAFVLEDGSHVTLNANSSLLVPRFEFNTGQREVFLSGEAQFSVRHTSDHQRFIVKTSDTFQVEVLGTEFTVFARSRGTKVALSQGKIRLDYTEGLEKRNLMMKPSELVTVNQEGNLTVESTDTPELHAAWKEQRFIFNNTSVLEICALIEENFGIVVKIEDPEIATRTITGNFKAQTAEDLISVLTEVLNLHIRKDKKTLLLLNPTLNPKS